MQSTNALRSRRSRSRPASITTWTSAPIAARPHGRRASPLASCLSSLSYVKCGLAGCGDGWQSATDALAHAVHEISPTCRTAVVAYADWRRAQAPPPDEVAAFVCGRPGWGLLLDTWGKDGLTLLDWMSRVEVDRVCRACRDADVTVALAGSRGRSLIRTLKPTAPDWFAVRGAACAGLNRTAAIDADRVRELVEVLTASTPGS